MSSTLVIRRTPTHKKDWSFKLPIKGLIARKFYDHDGTCGGGMITVGQDHLEWFEGVLAAGNFEDKDRKDLEAVVQILRDGDTIDMWFET